MGFPSTLAFSYQTPLRCGKLGKVHFYDDLWAIFWPFFETCFENHTFSRFFPDFPPLFPVSSPLFYQETPHFSEKPRSTSRTSPPPFPPENPLFSFTYSLIPSHPQNCHLSPKKLLQVILLSPRFSNKNLIKPRKILNNPLLTPPPSLYHFWPKTSPSGANPLKPPFYIKNLRFFSIFHENPGKPLKPLSKHLPARLFETPIPPFLSPPRKLPISSNYRLFPSKNPHFLYPPYYSINL